MAAEKEQAGQEKPGPIGGMSTIIAVGLVLALLVMRRSTPMMRTGGSIQGWKDEGAGAE